MLTEQLICISYGSGGKILSNLYDISIYMEYLYLYSIYICMYITTVARVNLFVFGYIIYFI
jgi:hypothetical protein